MTRVGAYALPSHAPRAGALLIESPGVRQRAAIAPSSVQHAEPKTPSIQSESIETAVDVSPTKHGVDAPAVPAPLGTWLAGEHTVHAHERRG